MAVNPFVELAAEYASVDEMINEALLECQSKKTGSAVDLSWAIFSRVKRIDRLLEKAFDYEEINGQD